MSKDTEGQNQKTFALLKGYLPLLVVLSLAGTFMFEMPAPGAEFPPLMEGAAAGPGPSRDPDLGGLDALLPSRYKMQQGDENQLTGRGFARESGNAAEPLMVEEQNAGQLRHPLRRGADATTTLAQGFSPRSFTQYRRPYAEVEQWSGSRFRVKRVPRSDDQDSATGVSRVRYESYRTSSSYGRNNQDFGANDPDNQFRLQRPMRYSYDNPWVSNQLKNNRRVGIQSQNNQWADNQLGGNQPRNNQWDNNRQGSNKFRKNQWDNNQQANNHGGSYQNGLQTAAGTNDPYPFAPKQPFRKPDRFVDNPQVGTDGVRHFTNGQHFDLSKTSLEAAVDAIKASDPRAQARNQLGNAAANASFDQNSSFNNNSGRGWQQADSNGNSQRGFNNWPREIRRARRRGDRQSFMVPQAVYTAYW